MHLQNNIFHINLNSVVLWAAETKSKASSVLHMRDWTNESVLTETLQLARNSVTDLTHILERLSLS